jgi:hypothetical protein
METNNGLHLLFPEFLTELPDEILLKNKVPLYGKRNLPLENEYLQRLGVLLKITLDLNG